jgi:hypothetical protein
MLITFIVAYCFCNSNIFVDLLARGEGEIIDFLIGSPGMGLMASFGLLGVSTAFKMGGK